MNNATYGSYDDVFANGQTQDMVERHRRWLLLHDEGNGQHQMEVEKAGREQTRADADNPKLFGNHHEQDDFNTEDFPGDQDTHEEQLQNIPEDEGEGEEGSDDNGSEYESREPTYIERHQAWVDILDENLQATRKNPANKEASKDFDMDLGELLSAVEDIIETSDDKGDVATETLVLDTKLFAEGIRQLQNHSLVIHTVDLRVTMAYFERWAETTLHQLLGVNITNFCQLDPFCFHVTVDSARTHIFANSPLKMGNKMVFPLPWDTRFSTRDLKSRAVPVWLELYEVHPGLMTFGLNMLRKIGPIIYAAKNAETQRINIIRGCVLMDLSKPPATTTPGGGIPNGRIPVGNRPTGNAEALNPNREGQRDTTEATEDFRIVQRRRTKPKFFTPEIKKTMKVNNRYGVLDEATSAEGENEEHDDGRLEVNDPVAPGAAGASLDPSSSRGRATTICTHNKPELFIREIIDLTKTKETKGTSAVAPTTGEPGRTTGTKHLQDDREKSYPVLER
ncbi:hypothetical protein R1sor_007150 [Riccia sorocarpa]|uniref:DUF4283 domain-containing protein n=1 Tax=Riccia sorocarpa TaxID=122646 RepID=A0ABD3HVX3_9MARC